jgi:hypothetical protein
MDKTRSDEVRPGALLPCPFCGPVGRPRISREHDADGMLWLWVECGECHARAQGQWCSPGNDDPLMYEEVRGHWNRRSSPRPDTTGQVGEVLLALVAKWRGEQATYPPTEAGNYASAAVRACADELEAALRLKDSQ